ncbi:hypothetical protein PsYK624_126970 [Phanerochaete sordida]|uniref:Terpenoid synthase n=1 Tax=Phanerochaete sordida TaxID=48140 RepID=A0A9P3GJU8_9APHY|nr:hypothetical protein PsYK624_126970 [Phanerochaete sordida]
MACVADIPSAPALFIESINPSATRAEAQEAKKDDDLMHFTRNIVNDLLARTGIRVDATVPPHHAEVEARVRAVVAGWDVGNVDKARLERHVVTAIMMSTITYGHTALESQQIIALYTICVICIDDDEVDAEALSQFAVRLQAGQKQLHPLLDRYAEVLARLPEYFCAYTATAMFTDSINFVNNTLFEQKLERMHLHPAAAQYPQYKRAGNGLGSVYVGFIWDKFAFPDVSTFIQALPDALTVTFDANDVLSFYKEELSGDTKNFVHDSARVTNKDTHSLVRELVDRIVTGVHTVRAILEGGKEREAWEHWLTGYVSWHILAPRYRLASLVDNGSSGR